MRACAANGADAIEIGIPFSDPVMDGPVIQQASQAALEGGATPINDPRRGPHARRRHPAAGDVLLQHRVPRRSRAVRSAGRPRPASPAAIVPDLPLEESGEWCAAADETGIETVMLAAPTASDDRLARVVERARGFVYSVGLLGVTGERDQLAASGDRPRVAGEGAHRPPVLVGVGVSNAEQAVEASTRRRRRHPGRVGGPADDGARRRRGRRLRRRGPRRARRWADPQTSVGQRYGRRHARNR